MKNVNWQQVTNNNDLRRFLIGTLSELRTQNPYVNNHATLVDVLSGGIKAIGYTSSLDIKVTPPKSPVGQYGVAVSLVSPINNVPFSFALRP
jgi:hypothetical protein